MVLPDLANGRARRRVALLMDAIDDPYQAGIVRGAAAAAAHANIDLLCIAGGVLSGDERELRRHRNFLYDLVDPRDFDGIVVLGGSLGNQIGREALGEWMRRFGELPQVSLGVELAGCHNVVVNGAPGMRDTVRHLIEAHHHRRIAFIRGPATSVEAEERFAAYREVLSQHGISEDPRLVLQGNWLRDSGSAAVSELFDARGISVDAVGALVAANDYMALGAMDALRQRGVSVPRDLAVTGFDDIDLGRSAVPPLTTVTQPTESLGREGVALLVSLIAKSGAASAVTRLPATVSLRRSCGCAKAAVLLERRAPASATRSSVAAAVLGRRDVIFAELVRSARGAFVGAGPRWEERLLSAVLSDLGGSADGAFLTAVDQLLGGLQRAGADLAVAQPVMSTLRRALVDAAGSDREALLRVDDLLDSARELVSEWAVRGETQRRIEVVALLRGLSRTSGMLLQRWRGPSQREAFESALRHLGFSALSLGIFTTPGQASRQCVALAAYERTGHFRSENHFRSSDFMPQSLFEGERGAILVQPLLFEHEPLGLLTLPLGEQHRTVYEEMRDLFGLGAQGYRLANA